MSRSERRRPRRRFLALAVLGAAVGAVAGPAATAQEVAPNGEALFGQYQLEARGTGVQARYEIEGLLPGGTPVLDLTLPETLARFGSGPTGYGLASLAYPGGILVNLSSLVSQSGADGSAIPDYPVKAEAFFPAGPTEVFANQAGGEQRVQSTDRGVAAVASFPSLDANPVVRVASVTSGARSAIEDGKAVARTRVELGGVSLLGGVITIDSLVTDLVAAHDGTAGVADGHTTATGVRFLGLAASLTAEGLVLDAAPPATGPAAPLGTLLDPLVGPLQDLTAPVRDLVAGVLDQAVPSVDELLAAAGIRLSLLGGEPAAPTGGAGTRSTGLELSLRYEGKEQAALVELINSVPDELKPNLGPIANPLTFLTENHITALTLGTGTVAALASPPFEVGGEVDLGDPGPLPDTGSFLPPLGDPIDFETPVPATGVPGRPGPTGLGELTDAAASTATTAGLLLGLVLLGSPIFGLLSTRLADTALRGTATSCPSGLDQPPSPPRPT